MDLEITKTRSHRSSWKIPSSTMAKNTSNPIRKIVDQLDLKPNPEKEMIALSIGDPTVFGNLPPAQNAIKAVIDVTREAQHNGYAPSVGYESTRNAIAEYVSTPEETISAKDVILASGCSGALDLCISVIANPGQNILVPRPGFSLYQTLAESLGIRIKHYDLSPERSWEVDLDHLSSVVDEDTAAIIVNNPSNPCGSVFSEDHLRDILDVCDQHKLPIIADEIYSHFVFEGNHYHSLSALSQNVPILSCGGLTKRFLIPGWRMGWITIHDRHHAFEREIRKGLLALSTRILGPNTLVQGAIEKILTKTPKGFYQQTLELCQNNATISYGAICSIPGLTPVMPQGAMYMMVGIDMSSFPSIESDMDFVERLVSEQSVFCLPAKCFQYPDYFRIVLTVPEEKMREACDRIREFCTEHYVENPDKNHGNGYNGNGHHANGNTNNNHNGFK